MSIGIKLNNTPKKLLVWSALFVGIVVSSGLVGQAFAQTGEQVRSAEERIITIFDRGSERTIITKAPTLKKALEAADISVSVGHDLVEPALDTELIAAKYNVNIYRARPVTVVDGVVRQRVTTAEQTPERIAQAADIKLYKEDVVDISAPQDLNRDGVGVVMTINRATSLNFTLYGKNTEVRTRATTVEGFLKEKKIKLGENDRLSADLSTNITKGMNLELWREGKQTITEEEDVDFQIEKIQDANREVGYREVKEVGEKGRRTVTYEVEVKNNQEVSRKEIASITTKESKKQVEIVGTKTNGNPLTKSMGVKNYTDSNGVMHRETYYDLPMRVVMGNCGMGGYYTVRADGAKVDRDGYIIVAANLGNYPRCSIVETSMGMGKVYDTGGFASVHPHGFDLATDWTNNNGI